MKGIIKPIIVTSLVFVLTFVFVFFPRTKQRELFSTQIAQQFAQGSIPEKGIKFEASYTFVDKYGYTLQWSVFIPPRNPRTTDNLYDLAYEEIEQELTKKAEEKGVILPTDFMQDVVITSACEK